MHSLSHFIPGNCDNKTAALISRVVERIGYFLAACMFSLALGASAQSNTNDFAVTQEAGLPVPITTGVLGRSDASALGEIRAYVAAVSPTAWTGMQGTGTITLGLEDKTESAAVLSNRGGDRFRLDVTTKTGKESTRIHGFIGKTQGSSGRMFSIDPVTASAGIFPFELPQVAILRVHAFTLIDHGLVNSGNGKLRQITFEYGSVGKNFATQKRNTAAIDFYFDSSSHLLIKSVNTEMIDGNPRAHFIVSVTYGDYRHVGSSMIPFLYIETINGQPSRTLQLSTVQLDPTFSPKYFEF
jgi:hypothetical protein